MTKRERTRVVVVTAFAEPACGPGWANVPLWVVMRDDEKMWLECLQPDEQTAEMKAFYPFSRIAHAAMKAAAESIDVTRLLWSR